MADPRELTREQFIQRLMDAGWEREEAEQEWKDIQNDEEGLP